jgi:hypothetical protein
MRLRWPLTGRAEEMAAINTAISDRDSDGIVLFGASGVGKSRIAREALSAAASAELKLVGRSVQRHRGCFRWVRLRHGWSRLAATICNSYAG